MWNVSTLHDALYIIIISLKIYSTNYQFNLKYIISFYSASFSVLNWFCFWHNSVVILASCKWIFLFFLLPANFLFFARKGMGPLQGKKWEQLSCPVLLPTSVFLGQFKLVMLWAAYEQNSESYYVSFINILNKMYYA